MNTKEMFPNGFHSWHETHYNFVETITLGIDNNDAMVLEIQEASGHAGLFQLALKLTNEFEQTYKGVAWGEELDWWDTIDAFYKAKKSQFHRTGAY